MSGYMPKNKRVIKAVDAKPGMRCTSLEGLELSLACVQALPEGTVSLPDSRVMIVFSGLYGNSASFFEPEDTIAVWED